MLSFRLAILAKIAAQEERVKAARMVLLEEETRLRAYQDALAMSEAGKTADAVDPHGGSGKA